jgi:phage baseplate assembly protein W
MPIPQTTRVNPLDLQKNIAIGVSLPFNGPSGPFNKTYSTKEQIKSNLINLLLTNKGERVFNPEFGADIKKVLFEGITEDTSALIQNLIITNVNYFIPEVNIVDVVVEPNTDNNSYNIIVKYSLVISGTADQITVQFI